MAKGIHSASYDPEHLTELKSNEVIRKRLAKLMARDCFRNSKMLENMHVAGQVSDPEMKLIMIEAVDRCYDFLMKLCSPHGAEIVEGLKQRDPVPAWDHPKPVLPNWMG